jgi:hypothetical protein
MKRTDQRPVDVLIVGLGRAYTDKKENQIFIIY